ncbi:sensor histidine kinase [Psychrobacter sp. 2Y5]|uniref:sensor histidine kinase n=1 Tax=unclassified Psychrobacter TaxID=196806 RepID=UPI003F4463F7
MSNPSSANVSSLIRRAVFQAVLLIFIVMCILSFYYGFVQHYKQQRLQVQQLSELLVNSASTVDGARLVARQVDILLAGDPALSSIVFYSSDSPILALDKIDIQQQNRDWYNAWFADSISFNEPVTSRYLSTSNYYIPSATNGNENTDDGIENTGIEDNNPLGAQDVLIGYLNITLDIHKLRMEWLYQNAWLLFIIIGATIISLLLLLRRLTWVADSVTELAKVCQIIVSNPDVEQLPVIQQRLCLKETRDIRLALVSLFNRSKALKNKLDSLAAFEQQLHNKDLSLNTQRNNFQSMITHELKTSLNAIAGGLQLLESQYASAEQKDTLSIIHKGSQHLEATIEQIIQLNKIEKGQMSINVSEFNPLQLLSDLFTEFEEVAKQKGLELTSRIHHIDYKLEGDTNKIKQILATLLENAIKFTDSGEISVESQLTHFNTSVRWEIKVKDTGIGIDKKYFEDIFTPFFQVDPSRTRHYEGVGVGLPVLTQIVQLLGGSIDVASEPKVGSQFTVILPLQSAYQSQSRYSQKPLAGLSILYYYNEEMGVLAEQLRGFGAVVSGKQHELSVIQKLNKMKVDMVMIAQEVLPEKAIQMARLIRAEENRYRVLIIYWYPPHKQDILDNFEYSLKAAGVDFCYPATEDSKALYKLIKKDARY